jgi:hypothetical protein
VTETEYVEVYVPPEDMRDTARKLLEAAGENRAQIERVETISGGFRVPKEIADAAGVSAGDDNAVDPGETGGQRARQLSGEAVSGDAIIEAERERGAATPEAVGAVFQQNSPDGTGADASVDDGGDGEARRSEPAQVRADDIISGSGTAGARSGTAGDAEDPIAATGSDLHGDELDAALEEAGLPKTGRVAEKQARLAEHRSQGGGHQ